MEFQFLEMSLKFLFPSNRPFPITPHSQPLPPPPNKRKRKLRGTFYEKGKAYSRELQDGPTGLVGGVIGRSLGSMNEVNDAVDDVLLFEGVLSVHGVYDEKQELLQEDNAGRANSTQQCGASEVQKKLGAYLDMMNSLQAVDSWYKVSDRRPTQGFVSGCLARHCTEITSPQTKSTLITPCCLSYNREFLKSFCSKEDAGTLLPQERLLRTWRLTELRPASSATYLPKRPLCL